MCGDRVRPAPCVLRRAPMRVSPLGPGSASLLLLVCEREVRRNGNRGTDTQDKREGGGELESWGAGEELGGRSITFKAGEVNAEVPVYVFTVIVPFDLKRLTTQFCLFDFFYIVLISFQSYVRCCSHFSQDPFLIKKKIKTLY